MTDWVDPVYTIVALIVVALLMYVMQKTEYDRINKTDSTRLQWFRRLSFVASAIVLLYSIFSTNWKMTCLFLVSASGVILTINAVALHMRTPPKSGFKARIPLSRSANVAYRVISYFSLRE